MTEDASRDFRARRSLAIAGALKAPRPKGRWTSHRDGDLSISWRRGGFRSLLEYGDFSRSRIGFRIERDGILLAVASMTEWRSKYAGIEPYELANAADSESQEDLVFAEALANGISWDTGPFDTGNVICFDTLHVRPGSIPASRLWEIICREVDEEFAHSGTVLFCLPFPLEFSSMDNHGAPKDDNGRELKDRRTEAMTRHYSRRMGMVPAGDTGWMAKSLGNYLLEVKPSGSGEKFDLSEEWERRP